MCDLRRATDVQTDSVYHYINCTTDACNVCGGVGLNGWITHDCDDYQYDENQHWQVCKDCGRATSYESHYLNCQGVCLYCGATGVQGYDMGHQFDLDNYQYTDTQHWFACYYCGETLFVNSHRLSCVTGACVSCGATGVTGDTSHDWDWDTFQYSNRQHWHACRDCGATIHEGAHVVSCATGTCTTCGATGVTGVNDHDWDWDNYQYSDTQHWHACKGCGVTTDVGSHSVSCATGACTTCGATCDPSTAVLQHSYGYTYNEKTHWKTCTICGYADRNSTAAHQANCVDKVCETCGMENVTIGTVTHGSSESSTYAFDETTHWYDCKDCGGKKYEDKHRISCIDGTCKYCGQSGVKGEVYHKLGEEREHDKYGHWFTCVDCGQKCEGREHWVVCPESTCSCGEPVNEWFFVVHSGEWHSDGDEHFYSCKICGLVKNRGKHEVDCGFDVCTVCGQEGVENGITRHSSVKKFNETTHWNECIICGIKGYVEEHVLECNTGVCHECHAQGVEGQITHRWSYEKRFDGDEVYYFCKYCGEEYNRQKADPCEELGMHTVYCYDLTRCAVCGKDVAEGEYILKHESVDPTVRSNPFYCIVRICAFCGEEFDANLHKVGEDGRCAVCYRIGLTPHNEHTSQEVILEAATCTNVGLKQFVCADCGWDLGSEEIAALGHKEVTTETPATCTANGSKVTTCETCGETIHTEELSALGHKEATTETPATCTANGSKVTTCETCGETISEETYGALGHAPVERVKDATCTEDGQKRTVCNRCGATMSTETLTALGHERWVTVAQRATCTTNGLRRIMCVRCKALLGTEIIPATGHQLNRTDEGDHWLDTCSVCGSQTVIQKDGTAESKPAPEATAPPEPTVEPAPMVLPVEVAVKPLEKVEIQDVPATVMIVVQEVEEQEVPKLELPEAIEAVKVMSVNLFVPEELADVADTLIPAKLKIRIELSEEEEKELAELKLVFILEDGTMQEIEFEIKDGKLVFETDKQGVFAFVPADTII